MNIQLSRIWLCTQCLKRVAYTDILLAENPFDKDDNLTGCPHCRSVNPFVPACEHEDCANDTSCAGVGIGEKYVYTCTKHRKEFGL